MNKIKKSNITRFEFIGIIVVSVLLFFVIVPRALAVSETRYHRSDTHTINGLDAYQLKTTNTAASSYFTSSALAPGCQIATYKSNVIRRQADGTETVLGSDVAETSRSKNGEGYQSATWNSPETSLNTSDAIKIVEKHGTAEKGAFITEQLGATKLDAATWTFTRYTLYNCTINDPNVPNWITTGRTYFGDSSYNTRIENFSYTPAVSYVDCGLRIRTGTLTLTIACEPAGTLTSALRIRKGTTTYGIVLVATTDANASPIRINTSSGVKALRKY